MILFRCREFVKSVLGSIARILRQIEIRSWFESHGSQLYIPGWVRRSQASAAGCSGPARPYQGAGAPIKKVYVRLIFCTNQRLLINLITSTKMHSKHTRSILLSLQIFLNVYGNLYYLFLKESIQLSFFEEICVYVPLFNYSTWNRRNEF